MIWVIIYGSFAHFFFTPAKQTHVHRSVHMGDFFCHCIRISSTQEPMIKTGESVLNANFVWYLMFPLPMLCCVSCVRNLLSMSKITLEPTNHQHSKYDYFFNGVRASKQQQQNRGKMEHIKICLDTAHKWAYMLRELKSIRNSLCWYYSIGISRVMNVFDVFAFVIECAQQDRTLKREWKRKNAVTVIDPYSHIRLKCLEQKLCMGKIAHIMMCVCVFVFCINTSHFALTKHVTELLNSSTITHDWSTKEPKANQLKLKEETEKWGTNNLGLATVILCSLLLFAGLLFIFYWLPLFQLYIRKWYKIVIDIIAKGERVSKSPIWCIYGILSLSDWSQWLYSRYRVIRTHVILMCSATVSTHSSSLVRENQFSWHYYAAHTEKIYPYG